MFISAESFWFHKVLLFHVSVYEKTKDFRWDEHEKKRELFHPDARYLLLYRAGSKVDESRLLHDDLPGVGFVHLRYELVHALTFERVPIPSFILSSIYIFLFLGLAGGLYACTIRV